MTTFSAWIEENLKSRNWKRADLARAAGVTDATVSHILNGNRKPGPEVILRIAQALGEPPEKVFRLAGLLPPLPVGAPDPNLTELLDIARRMPPPQRAELLRYARYLYGKR